MKISICVPVYGVEKYIARCAKSLFEQNYRDIEYIFVNDCSRDKSVEVLEDIINLYPSRRKDVIIVNHEVNKGLAAARNTAVKHSSGDFIMWVDSDDYIDTTLVQKLVDLQTVNNADIVCCDATILFTDRVEYSRNLKYKDGRDLVIKMFRRGAPHQVWGRIIRRSLYTDHDIEAVEGINQAEDYQVMPRLAYYANVVESLNEPLYFYDRTNENSYSNNFDIKKSVQISMAGEVLRNFFNDKGHQMIDSLEFNIAQSIIRRMKSFSLLGPEVDMHYHELITQLDLIDPKVLRGLRLDLLFISIIKKKRPVRYLTKFLNSVYNMRSLVKRMGC